MSTEVFILETQSLVANILFFIQSVKPSIILFIIKLIPPLILVLLLLYLNIISWKTLPVYIRSLCVIFSVVYFFVSLRVREFFLPLVIFSTNRFIKKTFHLIFIGILTFLSNIENFRLIDVFAKSNREKEIILNILKNSHQCRRVIFSHTMISSLLIFKLYPTYLPVIDGYSVWNKKELTLPAIYFPNKDGLQILLRGGINCIIWVKEEIVGNYDIIIKSINIIGETRNLFLAEIREN